MMAAENNNLRLCKKLLKNKTFRGKFEEKRLCQQINSYRDIISLNQTESNIAIDLQLAHELLHTIDFVQKWVGLVQSESNWKIWTILENGPSFGEFNFQIRGLKICDDEIQLRLKIIEDKQQQITPISLENFSIDWNKFNLGAILNTISTSIVSLASAFEWAWIKKAIFFLGFLVVYLITEIPNIINYTGNFILRLMMELNRMIYVLTPIVLGIINLLGKMWGSLLILIYGFKKPPNPPPQRRIQYESIAANRYLKM